MKFYAVKKGHKRGIYRSWNECQAQIRGFKNSNWKVFTLFEDAKIFLEKGTGTLIPLGKPKPVPKEIPKPEKIEIDPEIPTLVKVEKITIETKKEEKKEKVKSVAPITPAISKYQIPLHIYCASVSKKSKNTPQRGAYAIFFGVGDTRNRTGMITEKMDDYGRNLYALSQAFESLPPDAFKYKDIILNSNDEFCVQACTEWVEKWKRYGWKTMKKTPVLHKPFIKKIDRSLKLNKNVSIEYVRSESDNLEYHVKKNEEAHRLAKTVHYPKKKIAKK